MIQYACIFTHWNHQTRSMVSLATLRMISSLSAVPENTPSSSVSSVGSLATPLGTEVVSLQSEGKCTVTGSTEDSIGLVEKPIQLRFVWHELYLMIFSFHFHLGWITLWIIDARYLNLHESYEEQLLARAEKTVFFVVWEWNSSMLKR